MRVATWSGPSGATGEDSHGATIRTQRAAARSLAMVTLHLSSVDQSTCRLRFVQGIAPQLRQHTTRA